MEFNTQILRWLLLLGAAPIWFPFLKALWDDFNSTLAEEGGVFGRAPTRKEIEVLRREKAKQPDVLISEPWSRREAAAKPTGARRSRGFR
jgi:hypothetical protein